MLTNKINNLPFSSWKLEKAWKTFEDLEINFITVQNGKKMHSPSLENTTISMQSGDPKFALN